MTGAFVIYLQTQGSRKELSEALAKVGMQSEGFADPRSFLMRLKEGGPAACFIDVSFEDSAVMLALLKSMRNAFGAKLPLFALAAANGRGAATAAGATDVVSKPLSGDELIGVIAKHVSIPKGEVIEVPKLIKWFFEKMSPALAGLSGSLAAVGELEAQVRFYEERLAPYRDLFVGRICWIRKMETKPELSQCIRMYGIRNTRDLVVALKLANVTGTPVVGWNIKTGMLEGEPSQALKFANRALDHFGEGSRNQFEAFNAGLVLDLLSILAEAAGGRKALVRQFMEERYLSAMRHVVKCIAVGKEAQSLVLERHIITTLLMREAGKVAMALFYPDYLDLYRKLERKAIPPLLQHILELRHFGVSHNLMGALISQGAPGLGDAYKSVLFHDYSYLLQGQPETADSYDLIRVCNHT